MNNYLRQAHEELFGEPVRTGMIQRMEILSYILRNSHTPKQKHKAYLELTARTNEMEGKGLSLGHYRQVLNAYRN